MSPDLNKGDGDIAMMDDEPARLESLSARIIAIRDSL
jgi:hypothetical protein